MSAIFLVPALVAGGLLLYGLSTGRMPAKGSSFNVLTEPRWYWAMGLFYFALILFCVCKSISLVAGI